MSNFISPYKKILFVLGNTVSDFRMSLAERHVRRAGFDTLTLSTVPYYEIARNDLFIISRPGEQVIDFIDKVLEVGKPVIVDVDDSMRDIPSHNPAYGIIGSGNQNYLNSFERCLRNVTVVTTPSHRIAERINRKDAVIVPNCWDEENDLWNLPRDNFDGISIGWAGTTTHREDLKIAIPALVEITKNDPKTRVVIGNDYDIYKMLYYVNQNQKLFLPGMPYVRYPIMFRYFDILIAPLKSDTFNVYKSDIKLVEAGARKIPWVVSPLPQNLEWNVGGLFAKDDTWKEQLENLIQDGEFRQKLGEQGHEKALERTSSKTGAMWVDLIKKVLHV